jgi:hypothetical protein
LCKLHLTDNYCSLQLQLKKTQLEIYFSTSVDKKAGRNESFAGEPDYRNNHFFKTHPSMLKCISVIIGKMIVIIGITQKQIALGENER